MHAIPMQSSWVDEPPPNATPTSHTHLKLTWRYQNNTVSCGIEYLVFFSRTCPRVVFRMTLQCHSSQYSAGCPIQTLRSRPKGVFTNITCPPSPINSASFTAVSGLSWNNKLDSMVPLWYMGAGVSLLHTPPIYLVSSFQAKENIRQNKFLKLFFLIDLNTGWRNRKKPMISQWL